MMNDKKVLFSGMQATGTLTLGNYLGALKNWVTLSDEYECFYCVVDLHSITIRQDPAELRKRARNLLTLYIAAGLDPEKNCLYYQSHVSGHAELAWILNCFTYMGELNRMTQFKDKAQKHADNIDVYKRQPRFRGPSESPPKPHGRCHSCPPLERREWNWNPSHRF